MGDLTSYCMCATTFTKSGELDEGAFRQFLRPIIAAKLGIYVGSGGSGEGHALIRDETRRVYEISVEEAAGKVPVHANPPEQHTVRNSIELATLAANAGIEVIHAYTLAGWHSMRPTDTELNDYFHTYFAAINKPVAIAVNPTTGYIPKVALIADLVNRYSQITVVKLTGVQDTYLINLKELINREMSFHIQPQGSINGFLLGADGVFGSEGNIIPKTVRRYVDLFRNRQFDELGRCYGDIRKFNQFVNQWGPNNPRWLKMAMTVLKLPGWEGALRPPYRLPDESELKKFADGLVKLKIPEVDELARAAGLKVPG